MSWYIPEIPELIRGIYKPPFRYDEHGQIILDADDKHVLDIRGWGWIQYMDRAMERQDCFGKLVADALNSRWEDYSQYDTDLSEDW